MTAPVVPAGLLAVAADLHIAPTAAVIAASVKEEPGAIRHLTYTHRVKL